MTEYSTIPPMSIAHNQQLPKAVVSGRQQSSAGVKLVGRVEIDIPISIPRGFLCSSLVLMQNKPNRRSALIPLLIPSQGRQILLGKITTILDSDILFPISNLPPQKQNKRRKNPPLSHFSRTKQSSKKTTYLTKHPIPHLNYLRNRPSLPLSLTISN